MRKWHRWLSVLFGVFLLWIATTGVLSQIGVLVNNGGFEEERAGPPPLPAGTPTGFVCPETMMCRAKPPKDPGNWDVGLLHHLHSGESFGPVGVVVSILSGLSLLFFAFSGLWMYVRMWSHRRDKGHKPGWFWK